MFRKMQNKKGFTLAELLIVVAIIAVLVAVSIPIFTTQLEKAREATDAANLRAAYADVNAQLLEWNGQGDIDGITVTPKQTQAGWQNESITDIGSFKITDIESLTADSGTWFVTAVTQDETGKPLEDPTVKIIARSTPTTGSNDGE